MGCGADAAAGPRQNGCRRPARLAPLLAEFAYVEAPFEVASPCQVAALTDPPAILEPVADAECEFTDAVLVWPVGKLDVPEQVWIPAWRQLVMPRLRFSPSLADVAEYRFTGAVECHRELERPVDGRAVT